MQALGGRRGERVEVARQLKQPPKFEAAFGHGEVGYQHVAVMARSAEHVGPAEVRKEEAKLLEAARSMDPGQFTGVAKNFEHRRRGPMQARAVPAGPKRAS